MVERASVSESHNIGSNLYNFSQVAYEFIEHIVRMCEMDKNGNFVGLLKMNK